jgi:hypothetical protein
MAIAKKPKRDLTEIAAPDPMAFIQGACMGTSMSRFEFSGSVPPVLLGGKTATS